MYQCSKKTFHSEQKQLDCSKKICSRTKYMDLVGNLNEDLAGDLVAKKLLYYSKIIEQS
jgi:hypothetical protein